MKIKLLITLLFTLIISFLNAQNVTIPNVNFKNYLLNHTGINTNGDSEIQESEAIAFTGTINCSYSGIADLTGIEAFVNLTGLDCKYNQLTSLDISNNTALTYLDFRDNYLTTIDVSNNTSLLHLNTYYNPLTSLDVSNNLALTELICGGGNQLTSLDVSNNTALTHLNCETNQITSLDVSNNMALTHLSSNRNQLTDLDLSNNIHLTYMNCYFNPITCLDLSHNTALTQVYFMGCELTSVNIQNGNNTNITTIRAYNNPELLCIEVDDANWSISNWTGNNFEFDSGINFSEDCFVNTYNYQEIICDSSNDETESVDLTNYNPYLIENSSNYSFEYYFSESGALNQIESDKITSYSDYDLSMGLNTIYVRIDSTIGCYNVAESHKVVKLHLILVSPPIVSTPDIVPLCEGKNVVLNAGIGFDSYLWSTGETESSITISQEGEYWVTVSKTHDHVICSTTKEISVTLSNVAEITDIEIHDWTNTENTIIIHVNGLGDYDYSIDGIFYQDSNVFNNLNSGTYSVYVRDKNQCGIVKEQIYLLSYPKFFTPNGDGIHDSWYINFSYYEPSLKVFIFDRYGKLLKELRQNESWDGKFNGNDMPSNDYWFVVTRSNGKIHKGHFTLKR